MYNTAEEIIQYIRDAKKQTPIKVYINGFNLPDCQDFKVFGTDTSRILIGDQELENNKIDVKNMTTGESETIELDALVEYFKK